MVNENLESKKLLLDTLGMLYKVCFMFEIEINEEDSEFFSDILSMMNGLST